MRLVTALLLGLVSQQVEGRIWGGSGSQKVPAPNFKNSPSSDISIGGRSLGFEGESVMASDWFSMDPFHGAGWGSGWPKLEDRPKSKKVVAETVNAAPAKETGGGKSEEMSKEFEIVPNLTEASQLGSWENGGNLENSKTLKSGPFSSKVKSGGKLTNLKLHRDPQYRRPEKSKRELEKISEVRNYLRKACQNTNSRDVVELCEELQIEVPSDKIQQQPTQKFHPSQLLSIDWRQVVKDAMKKRNEERLLELERRIAAERETEKHLFFHRHSFKRRKAAVGMVDSIKGAFIKLVSPLSGRAARKHLISPSWEESGQSLKKSFRINPTNSRKRFQQPDRIAKVSGTRNSLV